MNKNRLKTILKYLIELLIIIFGVFLGLYITEVNTENKLKKETTKSIELIKNEIAYNKSELEASIAYFEIIKNNYDSISSTLGKDDVNIYYHESEKFSIDKIKKWNGLMVPNFEETAFEAIKVTGIIKEFDIELIRDISKIYKMQQYTTEGGNTILNKLMSINSSSKVMDVLFIFRLITNDLLITERRLLVEMERLDSKF